MRSTRRQNKGKNRVYFCRLCGYVAKDEEELDFHYKMSHEDFDDDDAFF